MSAPHRGRGDDGEVVVVSVFSVAPHDAAHLVDLLVANAETVLTGADGFLEATISRDEAGGRILTVARWASTDALRALLASPTARASMGAWRDLAEVEVTRAVPVAHVTGRGRP